MKYWPLKPCTGVVRASKTTRPIIAFATVKAVVKRAWGCPPQPAAADPAIPSSSSTATGSARAKGWHLRDTSRKDKTASPHASAAVSSGRVTLMDGVSGATRAARDRTAGSCRSF